MKIDLNVNEYNYLISNNFLSPNWIEKIRHAASKKMNGYSLEFSEEDADTLRDFCGEQLQKKGFDENYNPTSEGMILEALIDKFYIG